MSEIEAILLPASLMIAGVIAEFLYLQFLLGVSAFSTINLAAIVLATFFLYLLNYALAISSQTAVLADRLVWKALIAGISLAFLALSSLFYLLKVSDAFSRGWLVTWYLLSVAGALLTRLALRAWVRRLRAQGRLVRKVAVYGRHELFDQVTRKLTSPDGRQVVAGVYSDDPVPPTDASAVVGGMARLVDDAQGEGFDLVVIALPASEHQAIRSAAARLEMLPVDVQLSPGAISLPSRANTRNGAHRLALLDIQRRPLSRRDTAIKAVMDYVIASLAIAVVAPLMAAIAVAIKLDSRGPALFVQRRHGYNHRIMRVTKFRTMTVAQDGTDVPQAVRGDKRVTRVGRFLRKTSLDELPQLFDVLRGDLSLVGPRPHAVSHNEHYARLLDRYVVRHKVKPGITGWAQVNGWRGETRDPEAMRRRLECDLHYIENWSVGLDLRILARTLVVPFRDPNAY